MSKTHDAALLCMQQFPGAQSCISAHCCVGGTADCQAVQAGWTARTRVMLKIVYKRRCYSSID